MTDLDLITLQAATLYRLDPFNRLLTINEPGGKPAPRLFLGRTGAGNVWRLRHDLPAELADELAALLRAEPRADDLTREPTILPALRAVLSPVAREWRGPAYLVPADLPARIDVTTITPANSHLLAGLFGDLAGELPDIAPVVAVIREGVAVSVCLSSRIGAKACEAGVQTLAAHRGHGHASAVVAAWAAAVRQGGRLPLYSTSWDNLASQAVAGRLGMHRYGEDVSLA